MLEYSHFLMLLQVCQPCYCPSIHPLVKVILKKHISYQPLHCSNAAPLGRQPENGCSALPAVGVQCFQQNPERPSCSCLHGTEVTSEMQHLHRQRTLWTTFDRLRTRHPCFCQIEIRAFRHRNWSPSPSMCWTVSLHWRHTTTRRTLNCCSGKMWGLYARWPKATAKKGWCFSIFTLSQQYLKYI